MSAVATLSPADLDHMRTLDARIEQRQGWRGLAMYLSETGHTVELPVDDQTPAVGGTLHRDGHTLTRIVGSPQLPTATFPYTTRTIPKHMEGFRHDAQGNCIVESRAQEKWWAKQAGMEWR